MMTDQTLRVVGNECVFALGDVAVRNDEASSNLPATAQVAFQQADYVAWNIWALINNRPLLRFQYQHLGDMMSLGSRNGAVSLPIPVPPPVSAAIQAGPMGELLKFAGVSVNTTYVGASDGVTVEGPLGALLRRAAYLYRQPTDMQRLNVVGSWGNLAAKQLTELLAKNKES
jgi:NADH dehydrogenase FAD-containing subunit